MFAEIVVAPRGAIPADDVDLAVEVSQFGQQVMQQVELPDVIVLLVAGTMVTKKMIKHRNAITAVLKPFFDARRVEDFARAFDERHVTWSQYRTFKECVEQDPDCSTDNPMFSMVDHPGQGAYLTPGNPTAFSNIERRAPGAAPRLGEDTDAILSEIGYADGEIARLRDDRIVAGPS